MGSTMRQLRQHSAQRDVPASLLRLAAVLGGRCGGQLLFAIAMRVYWLRAVDDHRAIERSIEAYVSVNGKPSMKELNRRNNDVNAL